MIDVTNPASLTAAARWLDLVKGNVDMKMGMLGILLANKVEMAEERQISTSMAQEFCDANNLHYFEASAVRFNVTKQIIFVELFRSF